MLYFLHFDAPLGDSSHPKKWAQHYLGFAQNERTLQARLEHHRKGTSGVPLMRAAFERGIGFEVVWTREGSQDDERHLKNAGHFPDRHCTICIAERLIARSLCEPLEADRPSRERDGVLAVRARHPERRDPGRR